MTKTSMEMLDVLSSALSHPFQLHGIAIFFCVESIPDCQLGFQGSLFTLMKPFPDIVARECESTCLLFCKPASIDFHRSIPLHTMYHTDACNVATSSKSGILKLIVKTYVDELLSIPDRLDEDLMKTKLLRLGFVSLPYLCHHLHD